MHRDRLGRFKSRAYLCREAGSPQLVCTAPWWGLVCRDSDDEPAGRAYRRCGHTGLTTRMGRNCHLGRGGQRLGVHRALFCIPSSRVKSPGQAIRTLRSPALSIANCRPSQYRMVAIFRRDGASFRVPKLALLAVGGIYCLLLAGARPTESGVRSQRGSCTFESLSKADLLATAT